MLGEKAGGEMGGDEAGEEDGALGDNCEGSLPRFRSFRLGIRGERGRRKTRIIRSYCTRLRKGRTQPLLSNENQAINRNGEFKNKVEAQAEGLLNEMSKSAG